MHTSLWSYEAQAMFRPLKTYTKLSDSISTSVSTLLYQIAFLLCGIGVFVSITTAGRLVPFHVVSTMIFWSFSPILQSLALVVTIKLFAPHIPFLRALNLYFIGIGPWLFFLFTISGICIFSWNVRDTLLTLLQIGVLPLSVVGAFVWGTIVTWACFRAAFQCDRIRALSATFVFYFLYLGSIASYYFITNQIQPQLFGVPE